jgi:hypothetical protein
LEAGYSYIDGWEVESRVTPRRLPPQQVNAALRWAPRRGGFWLEAGGTGAGAQRRLNPGDRDDERIGASRRRSDIAAFFNSTVVSPLVDAGSDGRRGTGDDLFLPTSETLRQIQDRVLPLAALMQGVLVSNDSSRVPLLSETPAWFSVYLHGGFPVRERWNLVFGLSNPLDRNYRVHGSGVDAAGFSAYTGVTCRF